MPTKPQIQIVQIARKQCGLNEAEYRMILWNVAGVKSTTQLNNEDVERVMAIVESRGFIDSVRGAGYWAGKVARAGYAANDRMIHKIEAMAAETKYPLGALVHRMSNKRTDKVELLYPREAWMLIEALKDIVDRQEQRESEISIEPPAEPSAVACGPDLDGDAEDDLPF